MLLPAPPHTTRHPATPTAGHHRAQLQRQERVRQAGALRYAVHAVLSCGASTGPSPTLSPAPPSPPHTQVALIVYLAHVGSFVPATSARVGMCDRIFTRLTPSRSEPAAAGPTSVGPPLLLLPPPSSSFSSDLHQVAAMLRLGTER